MSTRPAPDPQRPACFGEREWAEWLTLNRLAATGRATSACCDCTPEFMGEMLDDGRCIGGPPCEGCQGGCISVMRMYLRK